MGLEYSPRRKWSSISAAVLKKLGVHFLYVTRGQYFKGNSPQLGTKVTIEVAPVTLQGATGNTLFLGCISLTVFLVETYVSWGFRFPVGPKL